MIGDPALSFRCSQCFTGVNLTEPDEGGIRRWVCENGHECGIYASLDGKLDLGIIREDSGASNNLEVFAETWLTLVKWVCEECGAYWSGGESCQWCGNRTRVKLDGGDW